MQIAQTSASARMNRGHSRVGRRDAEKAMRPPWIESRYYVLLSDMGWAEVKMERGGKKREQEAPAFHAGLRWGPPPPGFWGAGRGAPRGLMPCPALHRGWRGVAVPSAIAARSPGWLA